MTSAAPSSIDSLPTVVLKPRRALPFFNRHPWVFAGAIKSGGDEPVAGTEVALVTDRGEFVARGLYNPDGNIRVRLYSWDAERPLDRDFWRERVDEAVRLRETLFPQGDGEAHRLIFSEADGLSGLTIDRYGDWLTLQITSKALATRLDDIVEVLKERVQPAGIWLRTEKGIRDLEGLEIEDGPLFGGEPPRPIFVEENGVRFGVDLVAGQKTGCYLDQRDNRAALARYASGRRVLDLFCYAGGFGLAALVNGDAKDVLGVDASKAAIELAERNAELNGVRERTTYRAADVFETLDALALEGRRFGAIVVDPPKMTRHRKGVEKAMKGYYRLNRMAVDLLEPDGFLLTCTCSGLVSRDLFLGMLSNVAQQSDRRLQVLEERRASADHPYSVSCLETDYLQCYVCRVS